MKQYNQLPQVAFNILMALSLKERHGYEIIKQIAEDSNDKIKLGPGALYASIKQLNDGGLIAETSHADDTRRRFYKLTASGKKALVSELELYENALRLARQRHILTRGFIYTNYA